MAISTMSYGVMGLVDTFFVARLGENALAGVGLATVAGFTLIVFPFGVMRGCKVRVSQWIGAGRREQLPQELGAMALSAVALGAVIALVASIVSGWLPLGTSHPDAGAAAHQYLWVWAFGAPIMVLKGGVREFRYGLSDSRGPLCAALLGNLTNICLNPIFIFTLDLGVRGAALATVLGHSVELLVLVLRQRRQGPAPQLPSFERILALWQVGLPSGVQTFFEMGAFATLTFVIAAYSTPDLAAHEVALQVIHLSFLPALAASEAASILAGQAVGAHQPRLVHTVARRGLLLVVGYGLCWTLILTCFAEPIAGAFSQDPVLRGRVISLLHIAALFQILDGAQMMARAVLRGTGDIVVPAIIGIGVAWLTTPTLGWFMTHHLGFGAPGAWFALTFEIAITTGFFWWRLQRGSWLGKGIVLKPPRRRLRRLVPAR